MAALAQVSAATVFLLVAGVIAPERAWANPQPVTDWSFYVETNNPQHLQTLGCNQATFDNAHGVDSEVILDFGATIDNNGTQETINNIPLSSSQVTYLASYFVYGYGTCSPTQTVTLDVGTSNDNTLNYTKGQAFAGTVNGVVSYAANFGSHVVVQGANDIESWFNPATGYHTYDTDAYNWYNGWAAAGGPQYVDFGSADGCPLNTSNYCSAGWNQGDYYNFSWGLPLANLTPQIYNYPQAQQWYWIGVYAGQAMYPAGPLDDYDLDSSKYSASQAWAQLDQYFPFMNYSLEMHTAT